MPNRDGSYSQRLFKRLLRALPSDFQWKYGRDMEQVFRLQCRDAWQEEGWMGLLKLWAVTLAGMARTAPREHWAMLRQDTVYALRTMRRNRGLTLAAILTLALGIGANSSIFALVNAILLRPLPFRDDHHLVRIYLNRDGTPPFISLQTGIYLEIEEQAQLFEGIVAQRYTNMNLSGGEGAVRLAGQGVTAGWLQVLGVEPLMGRGFAPREEEMGSESRVALISHAFWGSHFGMDPAALGSRLHLNGQVFTVVGIMPPGFAYPYANDLWFPINLRREPTGLWGLNVQARLKQGIGLEQARVELKALSNRLQPRYPDLIRGMDLTAVPTRQVLLDNNQGLVVALMGAVGFVLLIVCVNIGNLLLARSVARRKEMAVRTSLGASRARQIRQMLTESVLLALLGGGAGLVVAVWINRYTGALIPGRMSNLLSEVPLDFSVLAFTLTATLLTGLLFGLLPALRATRSELRCLSAGSRNGDSQGGQRILDGLVAAQMALALVLLAGAGAMIQQLIGLQRADLGYPASELLTVTVPFDGPEFSGAQQRLDALRGIEESLEALPGVDKAGATNIFPSRRGAFLASVAIEGRASQEERQKPVHNRFVSPGFFEAMGIPILRGRPLDEADRAGTLPVVVISASMADRYWPSEDPLGQRVRNQRREDSPWLTIVGIAANIREFYDVEDAWYLPFAQQASTSDAGAAVFAVRTRQPPQTVTPLIRKAVWSVDRSLPAFDILTVEELYAESLAEERLTTTVLGLFAAFGLLMAALGIAGVMAFAVNRRKHEIGLRRALGAQPRQIMAWMVRQGIQTAAWGTAAGLAGVLALSRLASSATELVGPLNPALLAAVSALLLGVALGACCIPARRAARVDPLSALRGD